MEAVQIKPIALLFLVGLIKATVSLPTTPAPPSGNWTLKDSDGYVCMRMSFSAQCTVIDGSRSVHVHVDPTKAVVTSECASPFRHLTIDTKFSIYDDDWKLRLAFMKASKTYNLTRVFVSWYSYAHEREVVREGIQDNYLDRPVDVGKSYTCSRPLKVEFKNATVEIAGIHFQPFAEYSGGDFGPSEDCSKPPPSDDQTLIIALSVVGGVLLLAFVTVVVVVAFFLVRRRRYTSIQ